MLHRMRGPMPWWLEEAPPDPEEPPLAGGAEADVAIVGGGYTGLWTALTLKRRDPALRVLVLEADRAGFGPSGRNGGFCHGLWASLRWLRDAFGPEPALATAAAADGVYEAVRALGEDVWAREGGMLKVATTEAQEAAIDRAVRTAAELGVPEEAVALTPAEVAERCRSPVFRRGVWFRDGVTVQPARLVRALRRAALASGVQLHERTLVRGVDPGLVRTAGGAVRAREIVVATNAWMSSWRPVRGRVTPFGSYVVLTEPVPELLDEIGWTGGEAITDGRMFLHYFRTTNDGRVLMGSGSGPIGQGSGRIGARFFEDEATIARAERGLRRLLPGLGGARVERAWGGPIDVSSDHLPFFGTVAGARIHYGGGYTGNGVGPSWLGGQILASLVLGSDDEWSRLPLARIGPPRLPPEPLRTAGGALVRRAMLAAEEADEAGRRPSLPIRVVASLPRVLGLRIGMR
jgi:glycine/D-amino acid oxidase-like deaminating enzyme